MITGGEGHVCFPYSGAPHVHLNLLTGGFNTFSPLSPLQFTSSLSNCADFIKCFSPYSLLLQLSAANTTAVSSVGILHGIPSVPCSSGTSLISTPAIKPQDTEGNSHSHPAVAAPFRLHLRQLWSVLLSFHRRYHLREFSSLRILGTNLKGQRVPSWFTGDLELTCLLWELLRTESLQQFLVNLSSTLSYCVSDFPEIFCSKW